MREIAIKWEAAFIDENRKMLEVVISSAAENVLNDQERRILDMYYNNISESEISERLGLQRGKVYKTLHLAKRKLHNELEHYAEKTKTLEKINDKLFEAYEEKMNGSDDQSSIYKTPLDELVTPSVAEGLKKHNIATVGDVYANWNKLPEMRGLGEKRIKALESEMRRYGFVFR